MCEYKMENKCLGSIAVESDPQIIVDHSHFTGMDHCKNWQYNVAAKRKISFKEY